MCCFAVLFLLFILVAFVFAVQWLVIGPKRSMVLASCHVLVTGGSKGIGREVAVLAVKQGANVSIVARNRQQLNETLQSLKQLASPNQKVAAAAVDMASSYDVVEKSFHQIQEEMGPVDMLVCNVGRCDQGRFEEMAVTAFEIQMRQNFLSAVFAVRASLADMKKRASQNSQGCRIVLLSSQAGQVGLFGYTAYSPSKFALRGFAEALQMEMAASNIWVTTVYPPNTSTEGFVEEQETMLPETRLLNGTSGLLHPRAVAEKILKEAAAAKFSCCFGYEGWLLHVLTCGMSRCGSAMEILQPLWCPHLVRLASLFCLKSFYTTVRKLETSSK